MLRTHLRTHSSQYTTADVIAAMQREERPGCLNRAGYRDLTCSPFDDGEMTILEHQPAEKRSRSATASPQAPDGPDGKGGTNSDESDDDGGHDDEHHSKKRKTQDALGEAQDGPGPSTLLNRQE